MAGLVALLFSQIAEINNMMTVRHAHRSNQTQRPEQKTRNSPAVAMARLLGGNGFREPALIRWAISTNSKDLSSTEKAQYTIWDSQRLLHCQP